VPLKARLNYIVQIRARRDFETIVQDVYLGTIPYMTPVVLLLLMVAEVVVLSYA
jgi:DNA-directed RNA polymerase subunit beta